jgi:hypothetical protein
VIVVVVTPSMVMETSLTTVLAEPPPPDPELSSADCEDDVADVDDVPDVEDAADVDDAAEDDVVADDADAVTAALVDAIALIDMKTSLAGNRADGASCSLLQRGRCALQAPPPRKIRLLHVSMSDRSNQSPRDALQLLPTCPGHPPRLNRGAPAGTITSSHVRVSWSAAGEFSRASEDQ